eukprot:GHVP01052553.1.p1 GENE.GHVP01052553.1~~GHVP01052553.1.p1  ORF type:complete len:101 (-),score=10.28 GHVP01052553.1:164-466(-)
MKSTMRDVLELEFTDRTIFYFQEPEKQEGRRWTIRICNCYDSDLYRGPGHSRARTIPKDGHCADGEKDCAKFQITWKKDKKWINNARLLNISGGLNAVLT